MSGLLSERETFLNVALGAAALAEFTAAFGRTARPEAGVTLWHVVTVLPLVFHETSRRAIEKRLLKSGLRSILTRDPENDIAQNEPIFNINERVRTMYPRTVRSLRCATATGLLEINDGWIIAKHVVPRDECDGVAEAVVRSSSKLGTWAGELSAFEYLTILGIDVHR